MKKYLVLSTALLLAGSAWAEEGDNNMLEFDAESVILGKWSFDKAKTPGQDPDNDSELSLNLNYARKLMRWPTLQVGGNLNYLKDTDDSGDVENYGFMVGVIYNFRETLKTSPYVSFYTGLNWNHQYGGTSSGDDEVLTSVLALGKRVTLEPWGMKHLTYSPEIALRSANSTTGGNLEYAQSLELRFLQFAVFF